MSAVLLDRFSPITEEMGEYIDAHQSKWAQKLAVSGKESLYLRHGKTGLSHTIEYFRDGEVLVHTKEPIGRGNSKRVKSSVSYRTRELFAKAVPLFTHERSSVNFLKEAEMLRKFRGVRGIVQLERVSVYPSKKRGCSLVCCSQKEDKVALIFKQYTCNLEEWSRQDNKTPADRTVIFRDLLNGLEKFHELGYRNVDLKKANVVLMIDPETSRVIEAVWCDLGKLQEERNERHFQIDFSSVMQMVDECFLAK